MTAEESHSAWLAVFAALTAPPVDPRRAPCPNCGHFAVHFQYVADAESRVGLCSLWCEHCGHGHTLARTRVPDGVHFLPLDSSEEEIRAAIPEFWDATAAQATAAASRPIAERLAQLRPHVAQYELLKQLASQDEIEQHLFSPREREVALLLREDLPVPVIAQRMHVSPATVRTMIHRMYWKLGREAGSSLPG
jgi:DNA-binding CsgD family transcriptional regulator